MRVEKAEPSDFPDIIDMLLEMHAEVSFTLGPPNTAKMVDALRACEIWLAKDSALAGIIAFREATVWYSTSPFLADLVYYVKPSFRSTRAAALLLRKAKEAAKIKGLPLVLAANSGDDIARKINFYGRQGLRQVGATFTLKD